MTASTLAGPPEVVIMLIIHEFYRRIQGFIDLVQLLGLGNTEHKNSCSELCLSIADWLVVQPLA